MIKTLRFPLPISFFLTLLCIYFLPDTYACGPYNDHDSPTKWENQSKHGLSSHAWLIKNALSSAQSLLDKSNPYIKIFFEYKKTLYSGSNSPDEIENDTFTYAGHFYDPTTGLNWRGKEDPTGRQRYFEHIQKGIHYLKIHKANPTTQFNNDYIKQALKEFGMASHYLGDICQPYHAANYIAGLSWHRHYEKFADEIKPKYALKADEILPEVYTSDFTADMDYIFLECAFFAYNRIDRARKASKRGRPNFGIKSKCYSGTSWKNGIPDCNSWEQTIKETFIEGQQRTTQFLTRIIRQLGDHNILQDRQSLADLED